MIVQNIKLNNDITLEIKVIEKEGGCITVSQRFLDKESNFLSKTCTLTCGTGANAKTISWTCSDDKDCFGDCSDPNNPKGSCY